MEEQQNIFICLFQNFQHLLQAVNEGMGGQERERKDSQANTNSVTKSIKMLSLLIRCHMAGAGLCIVVGEKYRLD
jgi:hypothetical protein